jgi:hypothetical protein
VQEIRAGLTAPDNSHVEKKFRLRSPPDQQRS